MALCRDSPSMAVWETEDESPIAVTVNLPTPADTPYRTPSRGSRKSRRSVTPPGMNGNRPPLPNDKADRSSKRSSKDFATDESISPLDPRRFTPTLHANLVAEILSLRRDQEEKLKALDLLESTLHATKEEQDELQANLSATSKENRSLKRQLALLEGGTSSALGELARERDEAIEVSTEVKKRQEVTQKKLRSQEEDSQRVHNQWAKEKAEWEEEKRKYERKVHVAESRLKAVIDEVAAFQAAQANGAEGEYDNNGKEVNGNDAASVRTMSITNSIRFSMMSVAKFNGHSLADELNFDGESDYETDTGHGRDSVLSNHLRNASRESVFFKTHHRNLSSDSMVRPGSVARGKFLNQAVLERLEDGVIEEAEEDITMVAPDTPKPSFAYVNAAIQYSPPPSPKLRPAKPVTPEPPAVPARASMRSIESYDSPMRVDGEVEANQRRKRTHIARPMTIEPVVVNPVPSMVSAASQTPEELFRPKSIIREVIVTKVEPKAEMISSSTQTNKPPSPELAPVNDLMQIPSISIHPPTSRPSSPRPPRLPQQFKDFGCQVSIITSSLSVQSVAVQTEKIQMDKRLEKLPAHLHPSSITSRPVSPTPPQAPYEDGDGSPAPPSNLPPRNPMRLAQRSLSNLAQKSNAPPPSPTYPIPSIESDEETHDAYPGNNDDGPLSSQKAPIRRPHRVSSLFAGFDGCSSDEADEFEGDFSDSEFRTALSAPGGPRPVSGTKKADRQVSIPTLNALEAPTPPKQATSRSQVRSMEAPHKSEMYSRFSIPDGRQSRESGASSWRSSLQSIGSASKSSNRVSVMRKAVMIQNGIATHQGRSRSPSLPESKNPPFPIPTRASSRRPPISVSAPSDGQRSPTRRYSGKNPARSSSIRKVRSAAALPRTQTRHRRGSRSPPPFSPAEEENEEDGPLESPALPPLPHNDITTPRGGRFSRSSYHRQQPSADTEMTRPGSIEAASSQAASGVVDAIAQTMVGEWMFKYVRRRKSFGVAGSGDGGGRDDSSNDRHKRWVWLAPYERAILWSSKQPVSGSALMGKSGRKLTIQSVLDVKDDNPPPKGATLVFNRSILILTPQRALKFTAANSERHYLWLTALSFLAHSHQDVPEILAAPPSSNLAVGRTPLTDLELSQQKPPRRGGIRDSIRLAKGKSPNTRGGGGGLMSIASSTHTDMMPPSIPSTVYRPPESIMSSVSAAGTNYGPAGVVSTMSSHSGHQREISQETAEPPPIPRFNEARMSALNERAGQVMVHGRKRSNTGGHVPPPLSFRGFSGPMYNGRDSGSYHQSTNSTAGASIDTTGSSGILGSFGGSNWGGPGNGSSVGQQSIRTSEASSRPSGPTMNNFFDAIGTVRMEAFISPLAQNPEGLGSPRGHPDEDDERRYRARRRSKDMRRRASRSRRRESFSNRGREDDFFSRDDPFKGF